MQQQVFLRQLELAKSVEIADRDSLQTVAGQRKCVGGLSAPTARELGAGGIGRYFALFPGKWTHAKRALDMGFMISFAGNITFPKAQQIRDTAKEVPLDRILIETDSPFLAPLPHRGKRNEPAYVVETARQLGELRGLSVEAIGELTAKNFYHFFSLPEKADSI